MSKWVAGFVQKKVARMYYLQNGLCGYCGTPDMFLRAEVSTRHYKSYRHLMATFDHIIPKKHGGTLAYLNGVCACQRCNTLKSDLSAEAFLEQYDELHQRLIEKPQRVAAKRFAMRQKNSYMVAWLAMKLGKTVEDLCSKSMYNIFIGDDDTIELGLEIAA